jgi:predicted CXXCH cytochrome family protein
MTRTQPRMPARGGHWGVPVVLGFSALLAFAPVRPAIATAATAPTSTTPVAGGAATTDLSASSTAAPTDSGSTPAPTSAPPSVPTGIGTPTTDPTASATGTASSPSGSAAPSSGAASPIATDTTAPGTGPSPSPGTSPAPPVPTMPASVTVPGTVTVDHVMLALIAGPGEAPQYFPADKGLGSLDRGATLRVRFQIRNTSAAAVSLVPQLDYRPEPAASTGGATAAATDGFTVVPVEPEPGAPLYVHREWEPVPGGSGSRLGPTDEVISTAALRFSDVAAGETTVAGRHALSENPDVSIVLPPSGVTEQEFTVRVSEDVSADAGYQFRLSDAGGALSGNGIATVRTGALSAGSLSPGQRQGTAVGEPNRAAPAASTSAGTASVTAAGTLSAIGARYALNAAVVTGTVAAGTFAGGPVAAGAPAGQGVTTTSGVPAAAGAVTTAVTESVHGPYRLDSDECSACHRAHTGQGNNLLIKTGPQSTLCFTCHDGTGAPQDVKSGYTNPSLPADDPSTGTFYSHDALTASDHTSAASEEFAGVNNRHSECGDCHNAHQAKGSAVQQTAAGWTASGRLAGISGVGVTNGAAGTAPAYTFLDGTAQPITLEYQLCLKCHSGYTVLRSSAGLPPSRYALDKAVELNPANKSFHPVEAAGTNQTANMAGSLAGTSPYKLWNFTTGSTIRCTHCHAGGAANTSTALAADADLSPHASTNRGILLRPYRDQVLKSSKEAYAAADFALCYTCHAEAPFTGTSTGTSTFRYHRKHVSGISGEGFGGTDIDTPGAGQGNALCAECHYRIHGSSSAFGTQTLSGSRLVNFAPDVTPNNGVISWTQTATGGTCTLTCHGERHDNFRY